MTLAVPGQAHKLFHAFLDIFTNAGLGIPVALVPDKAPCLLQLFFRRKDCVAFRDRHRGHLFRQIVISRAEGLGSQTHGIQLAFHKGL